LRGRALPVPIAAPDLHYRSAEHSAGADLDMARRVFRAHFVEYSRSARATIGGRTVTICGSMTLV
jgi:hypothetical protein